MAEVFISYSKADHALAAQVEAALIAEGFSVWWDTGLTSRQPWEKVLERELSDAATILVLWTPESVQKDWVRREANFAYEHMKLVQAVCGPATPPLAFSQLQFFPLRREKPASGPEWRKIVELARASVSGARESRNLVLNYYTGDVMPEFDPSVPVQANHLDSVREWDRTHTEVVSHAIAYSEAAALDAWGAILDLPRLTRSFPTTGQLESLPSKFNVGTLVRGTLMSGDAISGIVAKCQLPRNFTLDRGVRYAFEVRPDGGRVLIGLTILEDRFSRYYFGVLDFIFRAKRSNWATPIVEHIATTAAGLKARRLEQPAR